MRNASPKREGGALQGACDIYAASSIVPEERAGALNAKLQLRSSVSIALALFNLKRGAAQTVPRSKLFRAQPAGGCRARKFIFRKKNAPGAGAASPALPAPEHYTTAHAKKGT